MHGKEYQNSVKQREKSPLGRTREQQGRAGLKDKQAEEWKANAAKREKRQRTDGGE